MAELTPEMEAKAIEYRDKYFDKVLKNDGEPLDKNEVGKFINWLYETSGYDKPEIHIVRSPKEAQKLANVLNKTEDQYYDSCSYGNISDYVWLVHYKYIIENFDYEKPKDFDKYFGLVECGIFDMVQFDEACIVVELPHIIKRREDKLHCEDGPALAFKDGTSGYFWMGVEVPEKLIMNPDSVTQQDVMGEENAEVRRAYRERLGGVKYYELLGDDLVLIDEDDDRQGYPMKLYETKMPDGVIDRKVQFVVVTDPSTGRVYDIYPPKQDCKNVWEAKASTFSDEKLKYRHGDVGFTKLDEEPEFPDMET